MGTVLFFAAGNAANGNGARSGDFIYTTSAGLPSPSTPVTPVSWGEIKSGDW